MLLRLYFVSSVTQAKLIRSSADGWVEERRHETDAARVAQTDTANTVFEQQQPSAVCLIGCCGERREEEEAPRPHPSYCYVIV